MDYSGIIEGMDDEGKYIAPTLRNEKEKLKLPFNNQSVEDAIVLWLAKSRKARLEAIKVKIAFDPDHAHQTRESLVTIFEKYFLCGLGFVRE